MNLLLNESWFERQCTGYHVTDSRNMFCPKFPTFNVKSLSLCSATRVLSALFIRESICAFSWSVHTELPYYVIVFIQSSSSDETPTANSWSVLGVSASSDTCHFRQSSIVSEQERGLTQTCHFPCHGVSMPTNWYLSFRVYKANWAEIFWELHPLFKQSFKIKWIKKCHTSRKHVRKKNLTLKRCINYRSNKAISIERHF